MIERIQVKPTIADIDLLVYHLSPEEREILERIFHIRKVTGCLEHPETMHPWLQKQFGSIEAITCQDVVKITNLVTWEGSLFNRLRASRPIDVKARLGVEALVIDEQPDDPLNEPRKHTPEDLFGRVEGKHSITASNVAKYDALHGIVVFDHHNPLAFTREGVADFIDTGWAWAQKAHAHEPKARYFFFMWNCLWKAGATLHHGHAQVMLSQDIHYARIEALRRAALDYQKKYGCSYFDDLYEAHCFLNCGLEKDGVRVMAYLAPVKDKEVMLLAPGLSPAFKDTLYEVLAAFRDRMLVTSFNLGLVTPPLGPTEESWEGFPVLARVVDRGDPGSSASDIGSMELYASSVISSDPLEVARILQEVLVGGETSGQERQKGQP